MLQDLTCVDLGYPSKVSQHAFHINQQKWQKTAKLTTVHPKTVVVISNLMLTGKTSQTASMVIPEN